jgi:transcriptional regulator with XRE-family HTH domain
MSESKLATLAPVARRQAAGRLRRARAARGWSQERAAHELGIGVRTLRDLELGRARMTALEALCTYEDRGGGHGAQGDPGSLAGRDGRGPGRHETAVASFFVSETEQTTAADEQRELTPHEAARPKRAA